MLKGKGILKITLFFFFLWEISKFYSSKIEERRRQENSLIK